MPQWADYVPGLIITLLFLLAILRLAGQLIRRLGQGVLRQTRQVANLIR